MYAPTLLPVLAILALSTNAEARPRHQRSAPPAARQHKKPQVIQGAYDMVVCLDSGHLNVRGENLRRVLFSVPNHEPLKIYQGFDGDDRRSHEIDDQDYSFIKVQFPSREARGQTSVGWVAESLVKPRSECEGAQSGDRDDQDSRDRDSTDGEERPAKPEPKPVPQPMPKPGKKPAKPVPPPIFPEDEDQVAKPTGSADLNDPNCCRFPTLDVPTANFNQGMRRFGANRSGGGRLHAACDLYRFRNEPISAVSAGTLVRDKYFFYEGTYAVEVRHNGGFVVRYGEVTGKTAPGVRSGAKVKVGQTVAYMGKVNSNCCEPMLHFELFSGKARGSLSGGGSYRRRSDLMNPTKYLQNWEANTFRIRK